jgi:hypothetical protein
MPGRASGVLVDALLCSSRRNHSHAIEEDSMRYARAALFVAAVLITSVSYVSAQEAFGEAITLKVKTPVADILSNPDEYNAKQVLVEGTVTDVCAHMGCWIKIADAQENVIQFKVDDGVIVFTPEAKGKKALAQGVVSVKTYTVEELIEQGKHHAEEEGKEFDPSTVTGPKTVIRIDGEGAVLR